MAVTYIPAAARDASRTARRPWSLDAHDLLVPVTSLVAILAIALAYGGQVMAMRTPADAAPINLNDAPSAADLERRLAGAFTHAADRRFAARELAQYLLLARDGGRELANVGALTAITIPVETVERAGVLNVFADRLRDARERAATPGATAATAVRLFTAADLAAVKPAFAVRTPQPFGRELLTRSALYVLAFLALATVWRVRGSRGDRLLLAAAHLLTAIGLAVLISRQDALRDTLLFVRYTEGVLIGIAIMAALSFVDFQRSVFRELSFVPLAAALTLSAVLVLFGSGPGGSAAKVNVGPIQPIEAIRLLLAFFLAGYFARRWELLRQDQPAPAAAPRWLRLPRLDYVLPVAGGVAAALIFFFAQRDLGPALLLSCVFLAMYAVARGRIALALCGLALLAAGFYAGYRLNISSTLLARVSMWQSPWDNTVAGGDQVAQSIWALATGGLFGTGLGFGDTQYLPAGHTDLVFSAIGEELGLVGLISVAVAYGLIGWRGFRVAAGAAGDYGFFLATAVTLFLIVPVVVMGAGALGVTPLTGVVTPFLSYGGSAMTANFAALGILASIRSHRQTAAAPAVAALRQPILHLGRTLAVVGAALLAVLVDVQAVRADQYVARPHLGIQADGVRRYQHNRRMLDVAALIPRGSIYDRRGVLLATADEQAVLAGRPRLERLGLGVDPTCVAPIERCYPLGAAAFHVLGDIRTRINWGAPNTSYVERDAENRLRGFDDHARTVRTTDASGRASATVRRDYSELVPLLRHRYDRDEPAVRALLERKRDLTLTLDAAMQVRLTKILSTFARRSKTGRAAAVVIDPASGDILAMASYPRPSLGPGQVSVDDDALLDRARYGLYPPGSTFKLVTATAALRRDLDLSGATFGCVRLPDGRVGKRLPGWSRPIRDDVRDAHAHGTIDMHQGIVRSCNAYFAQLAMHVGPDAILETALKLGISVAPGDSVQRLRATLPQAGIGQGDVVASPLRMARVAAAIANQGELRESRIEAGGAAAARDLLLPANAAGRLARYMRSAVLEGTGRSLRSHPGRIAGKTGTAEVTGAASHAWFVGFAPYGPATSRIAFAVIIENAGYGGEAAAPVAGDIVSAALATGLIK